VSCTVERAPHRRAGLLAPAVVAVALTGATLTGCTKPGAVPDAAIQLGPENVAVVAIGLIRSGPVISGTLAPVRDAQIRAQVGGSVVQISADQGQRVSTGQELAQIDAAGLRDAFGSARSAVDAAQTAADYAARQSQRYDTLYAAGAVSDRDRETVSQANSQAQAALSDAKARLVSAGKQLDYTGVRAPFGGVVSARSVSAGDVVQPGAMLFSVVDPSVLQLQAAVPAEQLGVVRVGQPVTFSLNGYGDRPFLGTVTRINPVADPSTRQVQIYTTIQNPNNALVAGLFASGRVVTDSARGLVAPVDAIDTRNLRPAVERLNRGRVERVDVKLGLRDTQTNQVEITAGVSAGDTLLVGSAQAITVGTRVRVTAVTDSTTAAR
jgi:RND family efflux transporter MFP subunit